MPARKPKALKREYAAAAADDEEYDPAREGGDEITMKITKRAKTTKTTKKTTTTTRDGDEPDAPAKTNAPQKIGFDITAGPVQDEGLHAKYGAMSLDELKQYMQARATYNGTIERLVRARGRAWDRGCVRRLTIRAREAFSASRR